MIKSISFYFVGNKTLDVLLKEYNKRNKEKNE